MRATAEPTSGGRKIPGGGSGSAWSVEPCADVRKEPSGLLLAAEVEAMIVDLDETLEQYVQQLVSTGRYNNASEVIREALRLKIQADEEHAARLEALKRDVTHAREQVRRGEVVETCLEAFLNRSRG